MDTQGTELAVPQREPELSTHRYVLRRGRFGFWYIQHPVNPLLAWGGARWVGHDRGLPTGHFQVCNFFDADEATEYAEVCFA